MNDSSPDDSLMSSLAAPVFNPESPGRFVLALALLVDAGLVAFAYQSFEYGQPRIFTLLGAAGIAVLLVTPGLMALVKPTKLAVRLAAGVAIAMLVLLAGIAFMSMLAGAMDLSNSYDPTMTFIGVLLLAALQVAVLFAAASILDRSVVHLLAGAVFPAFGVWFSVLGVHLVIGFWQRLIPFG
jgi:hypothetical protein